MPQLSLYMDEASMSFLKEQSQREGVSLSKYARKRLTKTDNSWPDSFWKTYGAVTDPSFTVPDDIDTEPDGPLPSFDD